MYSNIAFFKPRYEHPQPARDSNLRSIVRNSDDLSAERQTKLQTCLRPALSSPPGMKFVPQWWSWPLWSQAVKGEHLYNLRSPRRTHSFR
jgi:hypothetical protein